MEPWRLAQALDAHPYRTFKRSVFGASGSLSAQQAMWVMRGVMASGEVKRVTLSPSTKRRGNACSFAELR
jgi:hypothetical protein